MILHGLAAIRPPVCIKEFLRACRSYPWKKAAQPKVMRWSAFSGNGSENTLRQVVALLIEKLVECVVEDDAGELEIFREEMKAVCNALAPDLPPEDLLVLAGSATGVLEKYN